VKPAAFLLAERPAALGPGDAGDRVHAIRLDLADTDLRAAASTLARLLRGIGPWIGGAGPIRIQRRGLFLCRPLREAVSCLQLFLKSPVTPELFTDAARECREAAYRLKRHGGLWTATAFAEAACALDPRQPWHALEVGCLAREQRRSDAAWAWAPVGRASGA
jgi:hypothetical protein